MPHKGFCHTNEKILFDRSEKGEGVGLVKTAQINN